MERKGRKRTGWVVAMVKREMREEDLTVDK